MPAENVSTFLDPELDRTSIEPQTQDLTRECLEHWYWSMRLSRTFEQRLGRLYRQGKIEGAVYLGIGQEATSVGAASLLRDGDYWSTVARNLSAWFLRGVDPRLVMARWFGRDEAPQHGRDLGLFLADLENSGLAPYANGSMAAWLPSGAGFAWSLKQKGRGDIYLAFTGDGATSPGDFYEGLNMAALHKLPLVVVVENNGYAYSTPNSTQMPVNNVADRAAAFGIPAEIGFGNDVFEVRRLTQKAVEHARSGKGPYLLEFKCFRVRGHGEHDDMGYVSPIEREFWEKRDPISLFRNYLLGAGGFSAGELDAIDKQCDRIVDEAVAFAESRPVPSPADVAKGVFAP